MADWKTTITGVIASVALLLSHFGIVIPDTVQVFIVAAALFVLGLLGKDSKPAQ